MGKHPPAYQHACGDDAPICGCNISHSDDVKYDDTSPNNLIDDNTQLQLTDDKKINELLIIGAGPHAHALLLRLLSPEPDFLSEKERHRMAEFKERMRPPRDVRAYLKKLCRGPNATLKQPRKKKGTPPDTSPPPLALEDINKSVLVIDKHGSWMKYWKDNFNALQIPKLRSLMSAHNCPYDHRSLEYYAEMRDRDHELVTLENLNQKDKTFKGPYQVPSTAIFNEFHDLLSRAYGIENGVTTGTVLSINPQEIDGDDAIFDVVIQNHNGRRSTVKTRRVVCALGPMFRPLQASWSFDLPPEALDKILHSHEICPFINSKHNENRQEGEECIGRVLIVGGGITSAQLALLCSRAMWCKEVTLIQRSSMKPRHFDIANEWMGPKRGKLLEHFWCLDNMNERARVLKEARGGGTIPPEVIHELLASQSEQLMVKTEVEIEEVIWGNGCFRVSLDDGTESEYDMIWLATGAANHIDNYPVLTKLREVLPVSVANGLPVLSDDLKWTCPKGGTDEPAWKQAARRNCYVMGALAGLSLGPDSLNLIGTRHGSVKVAQSIRRDFEDQRMTMLKSESEEEECDCGVC